MFDTQSLKVVASSSAKFAAIGAFIGSVILGRKGAIVGGAIGAFAGNIWGESQIDREHSDTSIDEENDRKNKDVLTVF